MNHAPFRRTLHLMQSIALAFLVLLGLLMLHDAIRGQRVLAAGLEQLEQLKRQDMDNPKLAQTARELDYLYRSAYFQTHDKRRFGIRLFGIGLLAACLLLALERTL
ncbi:MAG: hypothetical protein J6334_02685, partial [Kiritimatiellae bacterium]|nr:hypothetical protein [Kiritimatiellia bacterium]